MARNYLQPISIRACQEKNDVLGFSGAITFGATVTDVSLKGMDRKCVPSVGRQLTRWEKRSSQAVENVTVPGTALPRARRHPGRKATKEYAVRLILLLIALLISI